MSEEGVKLSSSKKKVIVIGSGPIRIGQGIEFDYSCVHCVWALQECGCEAVIVNNNPETVSTDFDTSDRLYFEPLTEEDCLNIIERETTDDLESFLGIIVQFGGQTAINLAEPLHHQGVPILGTPFDSIDLAEDRNRFERLLNELSIPKPPGRAVVATDAAAEVAAEIGYPVLVRPSYVLGGRAMEIIFNENDLYSYMTYATDVSPKKPILVDKYIFGKEVEVDVIADGKDCLIPGIMEHIERAGVHSGDSMAVYPPQTISPQVIDQITNHTLVLAKALDVVGVMNIQYVVENEQAYILEVNPRASRTVPYLSKITGVPIVGVAVRAMMGQSLAAQGYAGGLYPKRSIVTVKAPVFSFSKLTEVDIELGPEMKSTGEIMGVDTDFSRALYKAMVASGYDLPLSGSMLATIADRDKEESVEIIRGFQELGYRIYTTEGTNKFLRERGVETVYVTKLGDINEPAGIPRLMDLIINKEIDVLLNTPTGRRKTARDGIRIRRASVEHGVPCLTSLDTAAALLTALRARKEHAEFDVIAVNDYFAQ